MLVGDIIIGVRDMGPDPCQIYNAPSPYTVTLVSDSVTPLPVGTYFFAFSILNPWGESLASAAPASVTVGANQSISITGSFSALANTPGGPTAGRAYIGFGSSFLTNYIQFTTFPVAFNSLSATVVGQVPAQARAFLPDSDGGFVSAFTMYRWLNESLKALARVTNGIQDSCGIASVSGMRRYVAPGQWLRFDQCFYDGWELDLGNKAETFRNRNLTANISISLMVDAQSDTTRLELYWTPSRTSGVTTTSATLNSGDTNVSINSPTGWLLQDGFAQVGAEIISYSAQTSSQLQNIIRGWGGTQAPASLASAAAVKELNIELTGYRMPAVYSVGQSALTLGVPPGWEPFLKDYMLGMFRDAEQERQEASDLKKSATSGLEQWVKSNKPVAGPRQCRMYGDYGIRGLVPGGLTGGIIIP